MEEPHRSRGISRLPFRSIHEDSLRFWQGCDSMQITQIPFCYVEWNIWFHFSYLIQSRRSARTGCEEQQRQANNDPFDHSLGNCEAVATETELFISSQRTERRF